MMMKKQQQRMKMESLKTRRWPFFGSKHNIDNRDDNSDSSCCNNNNNNNKPSLIVNAILMSESLLQLGSESTMFDRGPVYVVHKSLSMAGLPHDDMPTPIMIFRVLLVVVVTLISYYLCWGKRHHSKRKALQVDLKHAQERVKILQEQLKELDRQEKEKLLSSSATTTSTNNNKQQQPIRIFMDGAFDLLHYGHMNAFRLARSLGTELIVGVNSDESITRCKGAPLMTDDERLTMVQTCKFVDEIVQDCPYVMSPEYLDWVIKEYNIDYVVHGSDPCFTLDGQDVYASAKDMGKFRTIPRTEGVSTSDILGRILVTTREHHIYHKNDNNDRKDDDNDNNNNNKEDEEEDDDSGNHQFSVLGQQKSKFLTTSSLLKSFSAGIKAPKKGMKIIYIDGTWDLFHPGHVAILKAARERGDYLIVGIHGDATVNRLRGMNMPLMNLHERVLSVLGCQYVDDILIDAPYEITPEMVARLKVSEVVCGTKHDDCGVPYADNMYDYPKRAGMLTVIESPSTFNLANIVRRIRKNQATFEAKFDRKMKAENEFYKQVHSKQLTESQ